MKGDELSGHPPYRLACLCHDVGKLAKRRDGGEFTDDGHAEASARFLREQVDAKEAATLVETHHSEKPDNRDHALLQAANRLSKQSAGEDVEEEGADPRLTDVFDIFGADSERTYPLEPLALDDVMFPNAAGPRTGDADTEFATSGSDRMIRAYTLLWEQLESTVETDSSYEQLLAALERYTWCIPTDLAGNSVPLYDHLRTTTAIGDALAGSDLSTETLEQLAAGESADEPLFTLVKGDISGIQAFIHQMRSPDDAQERFAKRLRGRSTQLWLLTEGLARLFLDRLDLPPTSLIWSGGGQFYAVVPAGRNVAIDAFEQEVTEWLLDRYGADLFFVAGRATATGATPFSKLFGQTASDTSMRKYQKASPGVDGINSAVLGPPVEPCRSCGRDNHTDNERCHVCQVQEELGDGIATATHLSLTDCYDEDADFAIDLAEGGLSWRLTTGPVAGDRCYRLNDTTSTDAREDGFLFTGATVPHGGAVDRVWSFRELTVLARSDADMIHVCKMDIDSLGEAISTGMEGGPARLAAISRALDRFFAGYVNKLAEDASYLHVEKACEDCEELLANGVQRRVDHSEGPGSVSEGEYVTVCDDTEQELHTDCVTAVSPVYIGFSGGDDMFFVGPWDEAIKFARTVRGEFARYTDGALTVSGGFFLTKSSYPVGRAVERAESSLDKAKQLQYDGQNKNAARVFSRTHVWETDNDTPGVEDLLVFGERLETLVEEDELPRSVLHNFGTFRNETYPKQISSTGVTVPKDASWRLKYMLARQFEGQLLTELEEKLPAALPWLDIPVSWATLATR